jgi:hypothetical protein
MLTINNPGEVWAHDKLRASLEDLKLQYYCMSDEKGLEEDTLHTHVYLVRTSSAIRFSTLKAKFPTAHIETAKGNSEECRDYVQKSGKWTGDKKAETSIPGSFEEWGELPVEAPGQRTDLVIAYEMLADGATVMDVIRANPEMMRYRNVLDQTRNDLIAEESRNAFRQLEVTYIEGATGLGKTKFAMEAYGYDSAFQVTGYRHGCFDRYRGEDVLILDEYASDFTLQELNQYLDGYPISLPCRYQNRPACYTKVFIVSNFSLKEQYRDIRLTNPGLWQTFARRINSVMVFYALGEYKIFTTSEYLNPPPDPGADNFQEIDDTNDLPFD